MTEAMNRRDRDQLAQVAKMRAKLAKGLVEARELTLRAQVEEQLVDVVAADEALQNKALEIASTIGREAQRDLTERLEAAGIPDRLRPAFQLVKPETIFRQSTPTMRANALRGIAWRKIDALGQQAKNAIDSACADTVTDLITGGLTSVEAQKFLERMPTVDSLMLAPSIAELESVYDEQNRKQLGQ